MEPWQLAFRHLVLYGLMVCSSIIIVAFVVGLAIFRAIDKEACSVDLSDWPDAEYAQKVVRPGHKGVGPLKSFHSGQRGTDIKHE